METEESSQPNLKTETKYSLVKNTIVRAEKPEEEENVVKVADVDIHASDHDDEDGDDEESEGENNRSNKSVKFNEENNLVGEVGNSEPPGPVSARAVSTPASESSPRQPDSEDQSTPARESSAAEPGQPLGKLFSLS